MSMFIFMYMFVYYCVNACFNLYALEFVNFMLLYTIKRLTLPRSLPLRLGGSLCRI